MKRGIGAAALCVGLVMGSLAISTPASAEVEISRTSAPGVSQGARIDPTTGIVYALAQYVLNSSGTGVDSRLYAVEDGVLVGDLSIPYAAVSFDIDPTTQRAYIITSQYPTYTLRVVDLTTMSVVSSTTLPGQSVDIDADPDTGRVAVTVLAGNVLVFDGPTMGQIANVPLSGQPFRLAFSEGADKLYVTRPSASTVALSGASYATIESLPASGGQSLVLDHEADVLYMSSQNNAPNGGLFKVDLSTNTLIAHNPSPPWGQYTGWITLTDGGETLIGPDRNGYLAEVDTSTLAQIGVIGPQYLYNAYGDLSSGRLVALLDGGCCINTGEVVEFAPTDPPAVLPTASATTSTVIEGDPEDDYPWGSDDTETFVTVELDQASTEWARVTVEYTAGTATYGSGGDYYSNYPVDAYFAPGETEAQARLVLRADEVQEVTETLSFSVVDALGATVDATPAVVTVLDDDGPRASIVPLEPVGVEGDGLLDFAIELDFESESEVTVDWSLTEGSATSGDDFDPAGGQAVFEAGETLVSQSVVLVDDVLVEGDETFSIELTGGSGVEVDDDVALATIVDDDEAPPPVPVASIQPVDPSALESDGSLEFFVELDVPSDDEVTVDWSATAGTAGASDFDDAGGTAVFAPGQTLMAQSVVINDDAVAEPDESFTISLTGADGATVDGVDVVATIIDDDTPPSVVSAGANVSVVEGADGTSRVARVRVLFNPPTSSEVDVSWAASGITAVESDDYLISGDTLTVPAGTALAELEVEVLGDALDEPNETLDVEILDVSGNAVLGGDVTARVTITDDDAAPRITVDDVSAGEGDSLEFTVSLSGASGRTVTVRYATARVAPTSAGDVGTASGMVTFDPGETTASVSVSTTGDLIDESDERVNLNLSSAVNAAIGDNRGVGTIVDDDTSVVSVTGVTINEGPSATRNANFLVTLSNPSDRQVRVTLATVDGDAISVTALRDYQAFNGNVTFSPGQTSKVVAVKVVGDRRVESTESFSLTVTAVTGGADGVGASATGTITNDD